MYDQPSIDELKRELRKIRDQIITAMVVMAGVALIIAKIWL